MKKSLRVAAMAAVAVFVCTNLTFAASSSFNDVPAKHWAYAAVTDLAKAGIIEGYGDGTFKGDKEVSRYQLAIMIQRAMSKYDKADATQKASIDKLSAEFSSELNKLDARLTSVENKLGTVKVHGELRSRYEWSDAAANGPYASAPSSAFRLRARLLIDGQIADGVMYHANYESESFTGNHNNTMSNTSAADLVVGFVDAKTNFGYAHVGRLGGPGLGYGMLAGAPKWDGIRLGGGKDVKWMIGMAERNNASLTSTNNGISTPNKWNFANVSTNIGKVNVFAAYLGQTSKVKYDTVAVGGSFNVTPEIKLSGEYGDNSATNTKAGYAKAKYLGADTKKEGSFGVWAQYKKAGNGFDGYGLADPYTMSMPWAVNGGSPGGSANNIKGLELGAEYTVFKNGVLSLKYDNLKSNDGLNTVKKFVITELNVTF